MTDWSRRGFLSGLLASVGTGAAVSSQAALGLDAAPPPAADPSRATSRAPQGAPGGQGAPAEAGVPAADPQPLHEVIPPGTRFGRWRVVAVHPVTKGGVPVIVADRRGRQFQVDVLRRELGAGRPVIASTRHYALHLVNGARGNTATPEDRGLAVMWLAALMRQREGIFAPAALLTLRQRLQGFPRGRFDAMQGGPDRPTPGRAAAVARAVDSEQNPRWRLAPPSQPEGLAAAVTAVVAELPKPPGDGSAQG